MATVLYVDDSDLNRELVQEYFDQHPEDNHQLTIDKDGKDTIARLKRGEIFDVIVSDLEMPRANGDEVARVAREINPEQIIAICSGNVGFAEGKKIPEGVKIHYKVGLNIRTLVNE